MVYSTIENIFLFVCTDVDWCFNQMLLLCYSATTKNNNVTFLTLIAQSTQVLFINIIQKSYLEKIKILGVTYSYYAYSVFLFKMYISIYLHV
jgi:hypothetical protein